MKIKWFTKIFLLLLIILFLVGLSVIFINNFSYRLQEFPYWCSNLTDEEKYNLACKYEMTNNRENYDSDQIFANFRAINVGNIKHDYIYRGANPYYGTENRTFYVNKFLERNNIKNVVSLSEDKSAIDNYVQNDNIASLYFPKNYKKGIITDIPLNYTNGINFYSKSDISQLANSFRQLIQTTGNIYVHCAIGRDRTGIYCTIIECLCDASYQEMVNDYMISHSNYSFITQNTTPEKYNETKINGIDNFLHIISNTTKDTDLNNVNFKEAAIEYLTKYGSISRERLNLFIDKMCGD